MGERGADAAALCLLVGLGGDVRCPGIAWTASAHRTSTSVPRRAAAPRRATTHTWHRAIPLPHGTKPHAAANPDQQRAWWRPFLAHPRPFRPACYAYPDRACAVLPPGARLSPSSLRQVCAPSAPRPRAPVSRPSQVPHGRGHLTRRHASFVRSLARAHLHACTCTRILARCKCFGPPDRPALAFPHPYCRPPPAFSAIAARPRSLSPLLSHSALTPACFPFFLPSVGGRPPGRP